MLNDEGMHKRLKHSDLAHTSSSATQASLLVDIGAQLEETNSLLQALVSLQTRIPAQLDRSWTQDPVVLSDALGRVSQFHLDFIDSWEVHDFNAFYIRRWADFQGL